MKQNLNEINLLLNNGDIISLNAIYPITNNIIKKSVQIDFEQNFHHKNEVYMNRILNILLEEDIWKRIEETGGLDEKNFQFQNIVELNDFIANEISGLIDVEIEKEIFEYDNQTEYDSNKPIEYYYRISVVRPTYLQMIYPNLIYTN